MPRIQTGTSVILTGKVNDYLNSLKGGMIGKVLSVQQNWFGDTIYLTEVEGKTYSLYLRDITRKD